ncbi:hypothetical protein [Absidia glauca]|uniref:Fork-head domain-containing protein n=1 Tax=Absidia glauca TaxID=4829 RepID=A0A163IVH7_ABSGL|nr:hypothetical protein [Absidia glauca]
MPLTITPSWKPLDAREKPPYSYATLIAHALLSSADGQLKLGDIYTWIAHHYPFYKLDKPGWQNSIRHNLSFNKTRFKRLVRQKKGSPWRLVKGSEKEFIRRLTIGQRHHVLNCPQTKKAVGLFSSFKHRTALPMIVTGPEDYQTKTRCAQSDDDDESPPATPEDPPFDLEQFFCFEGYQ